MDFDDGFSTQGDKDDLRVPSLEELAAWMEDKTMNKLVQKTRENTG